MRLPDQIRRRGQGIEFPNALPCVWSFVLHIANIDDDL